MSSPRVNLDAIARRAGVSRMSVSRAINGQKGISEETRLRILNVCREMNYSIEPQISAAMRYIRSPANASWRGAIGLINTFQQPRLPRVYVRIIESAKAEAQRLGYGLEIFDAGELRQQGHRLTRRLLDCGVRGLILGPHPEWEARLELDWSHFTTVAIGYSLPVPEHHRIAPDLVGGIAQVCDELHARSYRRIALVIPDGYDQRTRHRFTSGYLGWQHRRQPESGPLLYRWGKFSEGERHFHNWLRKSRPDVVMTYFYPLVSAIERYGLRIPEEIGLVYLDLEAARGNLSGLYQNQGSMGAVAIQRLATQLAAADRGIPDEPMLTLVHGRWVEGMTTRTIAPPPADRG